MITFQYGIALSLVSLPLGTGVSLLYLVSVVKADENKIKNWVVIANFIYLIASTIAVIVDLFLVLFRSEIYCGDENRSCKPILYFDAVFVMILPVWAIALVRMKQYAEEEGYSDAFKRHPDEKD